MPLSEKIRNQIVKFSSENKHNDIVTYLEEQLKEDAVNAQDIFDYVCYVKH